MTFRDDRDALVARAESAEAERDAAVRRAKAAEADVRRLRSGPAGTWLLMRDPGFHLLRGGLALVALVYVVGAILAFPAYITVAHTDPDLRTLSLPPTVTGILMALLVAAFFSPLGFLSGAAAYGLTRRAAWGWTAAVFACLLLCFCGCPPLGMLGLVTVLRPAMREAFLSKPAL